MLSVKHRKVVVWLGKLGELLGDLDENLDRLGRLVLFAEQHSAQETVLRVARVRGDQPVELRLRLGEVAAGRECAHLAEFVRVGRRHQRRDADGTGQRDPEQHGRESERSDARGNAVGGGALAARGSGIGHGS